MRRRFLSAICAIGLLSAGLTVVAPGSAIAASSDPFSTLIGGAGTPAVVDCGVLDPTHGEANGSPVPTLTQTPIASNLPVSDFVIQNNDLYVLSATQKTVNKYDLAGNLLGTTPLSWTVPDNIAVDPS